MGAQSLCVSLEDFRRRGLAWPCQADAVTGMARQDMQMKMEHGLLAVAAIHLVQRDAGGIEGGARRQRDTPCGAHHRRRLIRRGLEQVVRMALRRHQHMARIHLPDVHEGQCQFVLEDAHGGNFAADQAAENAVAGRRRFGKARHGAFVQWRLAADGGRPTA